MNRSQVTDYNKWFLTYKLKQASMPFGNVFALGMVYFVQ
jgi:hypothetical protein